MQQNHPFPQRKTPIHLSPGEMDNRSTIIFVTICSARRKKIFTANDSARLIVNTWIQANEWVVGRYVILPDHIHFFCAPSQTASVELKLQELALERRPNFARKVCSATITSSIFSIRAAIK